ncbi:MarR family transcriptional regulator [Sporomusaceae bacterium FL31]|nr:MarR family transcriptional regulator [Sporomusaceae bacterium FL31]GCE32973.1 MarR family transcriptional regulator [Sporomusaceae bacterium]
METETLIVQYINALSESMRHSMRKYKEETNTGELFNLTITQLHYLHAIDELRDPTFKQLVDKFNVQKSTVTDIINRLIKKDLVVKKQSIEDLRAFHVCLTNKGMELIKLENQGYFSFAQKMTKCLNEDQKEEFTTLLRTIVQDIEK